MRPVILASTSPYRRGPPGAIGVPFEVVRPAASEEHLAREMPRDRALRLSGAKAKAVAAQRPDAVVIGSDQVAALGSRVLDKPATRRTATLSSRYSAVRRLASIRVAR